MPGSQTRVVALPSELNLLVNPGFEVKDRAASSFTANGVYTLDGWFITLATSTVTVSQITSTIGSAGNSVQIAYTHSGAGSMQLDQKVESVLQLRGRVVTFAVTLKSSVNATVRLRISDGTTTTNATYNSGTGTQRLFVSATVGASATTLTISIRCDVATCTVEANDATLVVGGAPAEYLPLHPADERNRCRRLYQQTGTVSELGRSGYGGTDTDKAMWWDFAPEMGGAPSLTAATPQYVSEGGGAATNGTAIADSASSRGARVGCKRAGVNSPFYYWAGSFAAEWNP